jgi:hypothetical protein
MCIFARYQKIQKIKMAAIVWNSSADNTLPSVVGERAACLASIPFARVQVTVVTGRGCGR